uniref:Uncharacterized protein n=1 Tax=Rhipicephalus zambeziensis TaxID=60191 RepID=A0A224YF87_9ACAR
MRPLTEADERSYCEATAGLVFGASPFHAPGRFQMRPRSDPGSSSRLLTAVVDGYPRLRGHPLNAFRFREDSPFPRGRRPRLHPEFQRISTSLSRECSRYSRGTSAVEVNRNERTRSNGDGRGLTWRKRELAGG